MARKVIARGSDWSMVTLDDGWGDVTDKQMCALSELAVERFHELCAEHMSGYTVDWQPTLSEVTSEDGKTPLGETLEDIRDEAISDVWEALIGNTSPMSERVDAILDNTLIVSRHAGAVAWLKQHGITGTVMQHVTPDDITSMIVVGNLPVSMAALCSEYGTIDLPDLTADQRGKDLSPDEMDAAGATLRWFAIEELD